MADPAVDPPSDEALMERFCEGDPGAFDALFARYSSSIHAFLSRMTGGQVADDLTQQTFLSLVRARGRFQPGSRFKPWLYAIAANVARDHWRRRRPEDLTEDGEAPHGAESAPAPEADPPLRRRVEWAFGQLPQAQREAILLSRVEGMTFAEIGEASGSSETAVKVRAHRGYQRLRELLKDVWEGR